MLIKLNHSFKQLIGNYIYNTPDKLYEVVGKDVYGNLKLVKVDNNETFTYGSHLLTRDGIYAGDGVFFKEKNDNPNNAKYYHIIRKINSIDKKRKDLGYAY